MSKPKFSPPEAFFMDPLLHLLPDRGSAADLESLTSSMFAKFEQTSALLDSLEAKGPTRSRLEAEVSMLRHVLESLKLNPKGES